MGARGALNTNHYRSRPLYSHFLSVRTPALLIAIGPIGSQNNPLTCSDRGRAPLPKERGPSSIVWWRLGGSNP